MSRFDYVRYDEKAQEQQAQAKGSFQALECILLGLKAGRAQALALTKLEEAYMWVGKAIRDEQVNERSATLEEGRSNS